MDKDAIVVEWGNRIIVWLAIGAFAGLRPSEIERLKWEHIHFDHRLGDHIDLKAIATKTAQKRKVIMLPVLRAWLEPIRQLAGNVVTPTYGSGNRELKSCKQSLGFRGKEAHGKALARRTGIAYNLIPPFSPVRTLGGKG